MSRSIGIGLVLLIAAIVPRDASAAPREAGAGGDLDPQQVQQAIEKGVEFLKRKQKGGAWDDYLGYEESGNLLCTLALLNCGVKPSDPMLQKPLDHLRSVQLTKTYTVSLQTMVFCLAEPKRDLLLIQRNAKWLEEKQIKEGPTRGGWSYPLGSNADNSNSQFALLALYEAERAGIPVQDDTWRMALAYWKSGQNPDGSWGYTNGGNRAFATGSMTCAGLTSLVIAAGRTSAGDAESDGAQVHCCGSHEADDSAERIERAVQWLGRHFTVQQNPVPFAGLGAAAPWHYYYLYGMERVGRMTARRFIGQHDWYREGAAYLISPNAQQLGGGWEEGKRGPDADANVATSFALLFLAKGRRPILMAKVKHGPGEDWNHHRNDAANLTSYVETKWQKEFPGEFPAGISWQTVDLASATVEDLLQSPVLFINGSQAPEIDERQGQLLRDYIDRGGFLFAEACCDHSEGFDRGFRDLMKRIFPPDYQLKLLPPEHPIWHAEETVPPDQQRPLLGIDYGCRTSVVYCPPPQAGDPANGLSCYWELAAGRNQRLHATVEAQIAAAESIGINVLAYATNRELKPKDAVATQMHVKSSGDEFPRGQINIAKLRHLGGCDTAPAALPNLLRTAEEEFKIRVNTDQRLIDLTDPALSQGKYAILFMHGRRAFHFTPAERQALKKFVDNGGTLMADSICSNHEFTESFRNEMQIIFAGDPNVRPKDKPLAPIPAKDPLFTRALGGYDLSKVGFRQPQTAGDAGRITTSSRQIEPELEGIKIGDRYGVIFSKFDLSCALENHGSLECEGYTREDATRLGLNILLYALHQ